MILSCTIWAQADRMLMEWPCKRILDSQNDIRLMGFNRASNTDITSQKLDIQLDPKDGYIQGRVITGLYVLENTSTINLDLSANMEVRSVKSDGQLLAYTHGDDDTLRIQVSEPIAKGQWLSLEIEYRGQPRNTGFGSYIVAEQHGVPVVSTLSEPYGARDWWPCKQDLTDKFDTLDVWVTVPENYTVASNGILESIHPVEEKQLQFRWKHRYPIVTYLVAFATTVYEVYIDSVQLSTGPLPVMNFIYPGSSPVFKQERLDAMPVLQWCDTLLGPYPFHLEKYGHAQSPFGGGMEHQTISFMGSFNIELIAHELAHHYFGNMITCRSWQEIFMNEGFASFLGGYYFTRTQDGVWWPRWLDVKRKQVFSEPNGSVFVRDTSDFRSIFNSRLTYAKGGLILQMLRYTMGDKAFFDALRSILADEQLRYGFGGIPNIIKHFSAAYGSDLGWYFDQWYYGEGHPTLHVQARYGADYIKIHLQQEPSHPSVPFFRGKLPFKLRFPERDTTIHLWMDYAEQSYHLPIEQAYQIRDIEFDPEMEVLFAPGSINLAEDPDFAKRKTTIVYPNPAYTEIKVDIHPKQEAMKSWYLYDTKGQLMWNMDSSTDFMRIPVKNLPSGMYWLTIIEAEKKETFPVMIGIP